MEVRSRRRRRLGWPSEQLKVRFGSAAPNVAPVATSERLMLTFSEDIPICYYSPFLPTFCNAVPSTSLAY